MTLYKFLRADLVSPYARHQWAKWEWLDVEGELEMCKNGIHVCRPQDLVYWIDAELWEMETRGEVLQGGDKLCVRSARPLHRIETWHEKSARLFTADCAEDVLHIFEAYRPTDLRPREVITAARRYAVGEIDAAALAAAGATALTVVGDTALTTAGAAAGDVARAAAGATAWAAAGPGDAALAAAWATAGDAARRWQTARARRWQTARLLGVLGIEAQP